MPNDVDAFIKKFLRPPKSSANSPDDVAARLRYWISVVNRPELFMKEDDPNPYAVSARRRTARQNLRRLLKKYPDVAAQVMREEDENSVLGSEKAS